MKCLIAVVTCRRLRERADVLRRTWVPKVQCADVRFFVGSGEGELRSDEVAVEAPDDYQGLRVKTQRVFAWSVENGYDRTLKMDDDVYLIPERLDVVLQSPADYIGRHRAPSCENDAPRIYGPKESWFCSGFSYVVSRRAAQIVAAAPDNTDWAEDRFTGNALFRAGIQGANHHGFKLWPPLTGHSCGMMHTTCPACLQQYREAITVCPYARPEVIERMHRIFEESGSVPVRIP